MKQQQLCIGLLALVIFMLTSCSVSFEKRKYRPGYHVDIVRSNMTVKNCKKELNLVTIHAQASVPLDFKDSTLLKARHSINRQPINAYGNLSQQKEVYFQHPKVVSILKNYNDGCDIIYFKNGTTMQVTSVRVVERKLYYNNCGDNNQKIIPINISTIKIVKLSNGDEIDPNKDYKNLVKRNNKELVKRDNKSGRVVGSVLMGIFGALALAAVVGFVFLAMSFGGWTGLIPAIIFYAFAGIFGIGGILLIVFSIVTGLRKD